MTDKPTSKPMRLKSLPQYLMENNKRLLKVLVIALIAFLILRSWYSASKNSLPMEVYETINSRYGSCVEVKKVGNAPAVDGPSRVCTELTTNMLGRGIITQQAQAEGITESICFRVLIKKPFMTVNEEIPFSTRIASKVAILQKGTWIVSPDQYTQDSEQWAAYACPGKFDISLKEWTEEY